MDSLNFTNLIQSNNTDGLCKVTQPNNNASVTIGLVTVLAIMSVITFLLFFLVISRRKKDLASIKNQKYCGTEVLPARQPECQDSPIVYRGEVLGSRSKVIQHGVQQSVTKLKYLGRCDEDEDVLNIPGQDENTFESEVSEDHFQRYSYNVDEVPSESFFSGNLRSFPSRLEEEGLERRNSGLKVRALYDFEPQEVDDLALKEGDVIDVLEKEESGWWRGTCGDDEGCFPVNYVEVIHQATDERAIRRGSGMTTASADDRADAEEKSLASLEATKSVLEEMLRKRMEEQEGVRRISRDDVDRRSLAVIPNKNLFDSLKKRVSVFPRNTSVPPICNHLRPSIGHVEMDHL